MSELKNLVPPLELCKLIPQGEFEDSALVWVVNGDYQPKFQIVDKRKYPFIPEDGATLYPAPTLQEILVALPPYGKNEQILACCVPDWADFDARVFGENWRVGYTGDCSINDKNPATAALKLYLKLKGIEG